MFFCQNSCEKRQIWVFEVTHDLGWWFVGKPMVDFLFALIEHFSLSVTVPELWAEMCRPTARLISQGVDLFALNFTSTLQGRPPSTILGIRKQETLGYQRWRPHPSAFPRFDTIPECDGQTNGRICRFAARCKNRTLCCFLKTDTRFTVSTVRYFCHRDWLGRPTYMSADLYFTTDSSFFFFFLPFLSAAPGARWTKLNNIRSYGQK